MLFFTFPCTIFVVDDDEVEEMLALQEQFGSVDSEEEEDFPGDYDPRSPHHSVQDDDDGSAASEPEDVDDDVDDDEELPATRMYACSFYLLYL